MVEGVKPHPPKPTPGANPAGDSAAPRVIAIAGMGPRGISVLERIAARKPTSPLTIHVIDPAEIGAGRIWDTRQDDTLCMNTLAGAVTLFTEPGASIAGPIVPGPTMYQWIVGLRESQRPGDTKSEKLAAVDPDFFGQVPATHEEEIQATRPESNPSRGLYGHYLKWVYRTVLASLGDNITVIEHRAKVVSATAEKEIVLDSGETLKVDSLVYAPGWLPARYSSEQRAFASSPSTTWIEPENPIEQSYPAHEPGQQILVRGLGMGFFDFLATMVARKGGYFTADQGTDGGLRYHPSGQEPHLVVFSRRGYPFLPKANYQSLPPASPKRRLLRVIAKYSQLRRGGRPVDRPCNFTTEVLPAILKDAYEQYYFSLASFAPGTLTAHLDDVIAAIDSASLSESAASKTGVDACLAWAQVLYEHTEPLTTDPFDLAAVIKPFASATSVEQTAMRASLIRDIRHALLGQVSPVKNALLSISASRKPASILVEQGGIIPQTVATYKAFMALGQMVGSGPPLFRTQQLVALFDAGLVTFAGPHQQVTLANNGSAAFFELAGTSYRSTILVDAWLNAQNAKTMDDRLLAGLLDTGRARIYAPHGVDTASLEVDPTTRQLVGHAGQRDWVHLIGIPTHGQFADTTISPMPGTDPLFLQETDQAAASALGEHSPDNLPQP